MEQDNLVFRKGEAQMELPPGFRFHPTDEELITHYLSKKVKDASFDARAVGEADLNKCEPWDLPRRAKMGEKEWYFFCVRDRKYPTGLRTNRATEAGYWKATGKDKEIYRGNNNLVGMRKTLVFYRGRAPKGEKSEWVMHEYRLQGKFSACHLSKPAKSEWVICRVFKKSCVEKKTRTTEDEIGGSRSALLPPLMDVASDPPAHVTCFSILADDRKGKQQESFDSDYFNGTNRMFQYYNYDDTTNESNFQGGFGSFVQLFQNDGYGMKQKNGKDLLSNVSQETGITTDLNPEISSLTSASAATSLQLADCFWSY